MNASSLVLLLGLVYLLVGAGIGGNLLRRGLPRGAAASALVAWPLLLGSADGRAAGRGPYAARIHRGLADLQGALTEPAVSGLVEAEELQSVLRALLAADARVAVVDGLLADPAIREATDGPRLAAARERAGAEIEAVLKGLVQLRVQLGLVALAGETAPVRSRLAELGARVKALDELGLG